MAGYQVAIYINFVSSRLQPSPSAFIRIQDRLSGSPNLTTPLNLTIPAGNAMEIGPYYVRPGPVSITLQMADVPATPGSSGPPVVPPTPDYPVLNYAQVFDLLPGQTQVVNVNLN
jgi:hypothetical protein